MKMFALYYTKTLSVIFFSASSLKQQSEGSHDAPLRYIIPISSKPIFPLPP